ncbi:MAG: DUF4349 domain-containing protein [Bacteroidia bacterium]
MKNLKSIPTLALMALFCFGCANRDSRAEKSIETGYRYKTDSVTEQSAKPESSDKNGVSGNGTYAVTVKDVNGCVSAETVSSSAARMNKDTARKFVRTADLKFRVRDAIRTSYRIEDIVARFDGFVTYTSMNSVINRRSLTPVSRDSSVESIYYTVGNDLVIRIPDSKLDTTLKSIACLIDFLDYRVITAEEVTLTLLSQKFSESRLKTTEDRLKKAIDSQGRKLPQTTDAEEKLLDTHAQHDAIYLQRMRLQDQVQYSTIKINLYQPESVKHEKLGNDLPIPAYEPGFMHELKDSFRSGWMAMQDLLLLIIKVWWLWVILAIVYGGWRKYFRKAGK